MMDPTFDAILDLTLRFEVGPWYDTNDPDVIAGRILTPLQKKKCGYVNDPADAGGETKFGIASNANRGVDVKSLTLPMARGIYYNKYWLPTVASKCSSPLSAIVFDTAVNSGPTRAVVFLQRALGIADDGVFGPASAKALANSDPFVIASKYLDIREMFFRNIVTNNPSQARFLAGWLDRINKLRAWLASQPKS